MADFEHKEPTRGRTSDTFVFRLLFPRILGKYKKYVFPYLIDKDSFSLAQMPLNEKKTENRGGKNFSSQRPSFSARLAGYFYQELATLSSGVIAVLAA